MSAPIGINVKRSQYKILLCPLIIKNQFRTDIIVLEPKQIIARFFGVRVVGPSNQTPFAEEQEYPRNMKVLNEGGWGLKRRRLEGLKRTTSILDLVLELGRLSKGNSGSSDGGSKCL